MYPDIIDIIEGTNTISSLLASKLSRNMQMFPETYGNDAHCLYKVASLPTLTLAATLDVVNCNWCN